MEGVGHKKCHAGETRTWIYLYKCLPSLPAFKSFGTNVQLDLTSRGEGKLRPSFWHFINFGPIFIESYHFFETCQKIREGTYCDESCHAVIYYKVGVPRESCVASVTLNCVLLLSWRDVMTGLVGLKTFTVKVKDITVKLKRLDV